MRLRALAGQLASGAYCAGANLQTARLLASCAAVPAAAAAVLLGLHRTAECFSVTGLRTNVRGGCVPLRVALESRCIANALSAALGAGLRACQVACSSSGRSDRSGTRREACQPRPVDEEWKARP